MTVICALANRLGAEHAGFAMTAWQIIEHALAQSGLPDAASIAASGGHDTAPAFEDAHFLTGWLRQRRFDFRADWSRIGAGHADLPEHCWTRRRSSTVAPTSIRSGIIAPPARSVPQYLVRQSAHRHRARGASVRARPPGRSARARACRRRAGTAGQSPRQRRAEGARLRRDAAGVPAVEGIWPNRAFEEGIGINALVSAEPAAPNGGAVYHYTAVWARPA